MIMTPAESSFTVDVETLMKVGRVDLPNLAEIYARLSNDVGKTGQYDNAIFRSGDSVSGPAVLWTELRSSLQDILRTGASRLYDAGDAVVKIAKTYAAADSSAKADVEGIWPTPPPSRVTIDPDAPAIDLSAGP
jgi:hypothetical protein